MEATLQTAFGFEIRSPLGFDETVASVKEAFKVQGFGVLTEIDVQKTLREKIGADMPPYLILGMCNPVLAHNALTSNPKIGLLLPCNVVVRTQDGSVLVDAQNPDILLEVVGDPAIAPIARAATDLIKNALRSLGF